MTYASNYDAVIESIETEKNLKFNMNVVIAKMDEDDLSDLLELTENGGYKANLCGTAGCVMGHTLIACLGPDEGVVFWGLHDDVGTPDDEPTVSGKAAELLRLASDAASHLFYRHLVEKSDKRVILFILRFLKPIAESRQVSHEDVVNATHLAFRANGVTCGVRK